MHMSAFLESELLLTEEKSLSALASSPFIVWSNSTTFKLGYFLIIEPNSVFAVLNFRSAISWRSLFIGSLRTASSFSICFASWSMRAFSPGAAVCAWNRYCLAASKSLLRNAASACWKNFENRAALAKTYPQWGQESLKTGIAFPHLSHFLKSGLRQFLQELAFIASASDSNSLTDPQ